MYQCLLTWTQLLILSHIGFKLEADHRLRHWGVWRRGCFHLQGRRAQSEHSTNTNKCHLYFWWYATHWNLHMIYYRCYLITIHRNTSSFPSHTSFLALSHPSKFSIWSTDLLFCSHVINRTYPALALQEVVGFAYNQLWENCHCDLLGEINSRACWPLGQVYY